MFAAALGIEDIDIASTNFPGHSGAMAELQLC